MSPEIRTRYPGAQPFSDEALSRKLFYGREQETAALAHQILAGRLVVLFARSGLGKTSLLNAGVAETLRSEGFLPLTLRVTDGGAIGPLHSIYGAIADACARQGIEYVPGSTLSLWHFFKSVQFWRDDTLLTPVLILDQFEELFTLLSEPQRSEFLDQFSCLVRGVRPKEPAPQTGEEHAAAAVFTDAPPSIKVVVSLREDFLACLDDLSDRIPMILDERFRLLPLGRDAAVKALEAPASVEDATLTTRPFKIDADAKDAILAFLERRSSGPTKQSSNYIEPFQLQLICQHVEEVAGQAQRAGAQGIVTIGLGEIGGESKLRTILKEFYRRQVSAVPSFFQRLGVRRLCSEFLINAQGRRLRMEETEIERLTNVKPEALQTLVDRRLLRRDQTADGNYYELSHDSLIAPVLATRRLWFSMRAVGLLALALVGLAASLFVVVLIIAGAVSMAGWSEIVLIVVLVCLVALISRWILRKVRAFKTMWQRIRI